MPPDKDGRIKGISVGKVWPGHRDYVEPSAATSPGHRLDQESLDERDTVNADRYDDAD